MYEVVQRNCWALLKEMADDGQMMGTGKFQEDTVWSSKERMSFINLPQETACGGQGAALRPSQGLHHLSSAQA